MSGGYERIPMNEPPMGVQEGEFNDPAFEDSPSYQILRPRHDPDTGVLMSITEFNTKYGDNAEKMWQQAKERNPPLLETRYRLGHGRELDLDAELRRKEPKYYVSANSTATRNSMACLTYPCCGCLCLKAFEVPAGHVQPLEDGEGGFLLAGEGMHCHVNPFLRMGGAPFCYNEGVMTHGDWCLVVVDQGFIGLAMDKGQPVLLPPGFHQWKSRTMVFQKVIDLNEPVIYLGPYTLLTVDEGYAAVTQDNGKQEIKQGGTVHFLSHRNHKFEKFLSTKVQTDKLARIEVITGDNVLMLCDATVNWKISDVYLAARNAAETMAKKGVDVHGDITKLRNDVLQQASASLSSFIGTVNYSDSFAPTAQVHKEERPVMGIPVTGTDDCTGGILFDSERMQTAVAHANSVTNAYGVEVISINIISAKPSDANLMTSLAQGAVAAAEAQQLETTAQGKAKALRIQSEASAEAQLICARSDAEKTSIAARADAAAEEERARGAKKAAELLESSPVAIELAKIGRTGEALASASSSLFFGADASNLGSILANPALVSRK